MGEDRARQSVLSHIVWTLTFVPPKGEMLSVFYFCFLGVWFGILFAVVCRSSLLRVAVRKIFRERIFVFGRGCWSCVL